MNLVNSALIFKSKSLIEKIDQNFEIEISKFITNSTPCNSKLTDKNKEEKKEFAIESFLKTNSNNGKHSRLFKLNLANIVDPYINQKTSLRILTETISDIKLNTIEDQLNFDNSKNIFITPKDKLTNSENKIKMLKGENSYYFLNTVSTSGNNKSSKLNNRYEMSIQTDRSICSKSTLRRAEEYLECLKEMKDYDGYLITELTNGNTKTETFFLTKQDSFIIPPKEKKSNVTMLYFIFLIFQFLFVFIILMIILKRKQILS